MTSEEKLLNLRSIISADIDLAIRRTTSVFRDIGDPVIDTDGNLTPRVLECSRRVRGWLYLLDSPRWSWLSDGDEYIVDPEFWNFHTEYSLYLGHDNLDRKRIASRESIVSVLRQFLTNIETIYEKYRNCLPKCLKRISTFQNFCVIFGVSESVRRFEQMIWLTVH